MYDGIIVGGGHAGCEAALAMARMGKKTLLITSDINYVASLPCNPSIGGPAKGVVVREIDSIGKGVSALSKGTNELNSKTSNLPDEIDDKIDEMVSKYSNSDFNPVSFASEENTNVESVQFAIRTDAIKVKDEEKVEEEKVEEKNMWQLFTDLFKKDK